MITCCGCSSRSASGCSGLAGAGAVGSATVGNPARLGWAPAPWPAMTTVSRLRSMSSGWSKLTGGCTSTVCRSGGRAGWARIRGRAPAVRAADVELHRAGVGGAGTGGGHQHAARGRPPGRVEGVHPLGRVLGQAQADGGAHLRAEVAQLLHGLVSTGAEQLVGPVGAQHDQRHPRVVGLHHRRAEVGHRGARRHRHAYRRLSTDRQTDGQVAGGALVDAHMQPQPPRPVGVGQCESQRRVARARAQHHVADTAADQFVDDDAGLCRRGIHS